MAATFTVLDHPLAGDLLTRLRDRDTGPAEYRALTRRLGLLLVTEATRDLATEPKWATRVLDEPELWGIESVSADVIVVRVTMKVRSASRDDVARELRARLARDLKAAGIPLPSLEQVVLEGIEGAASVTGSRPPRTAELPRQ